ncbi:putative decaprenylphosphoryl-beta-D-ribose oxidase [Blastochloris viridis]|nr:putative decaprenylphosphoryl-beta-D-ribose oxidase [Blastochloris viridis]
MTAPKVSYAAWGGGAHATAEVRAIRPASVDAARRGYASPGTSVLAFGNGRSYGDVCLNPGGTLIDCRSLDRFVDFDRTTGRLTCEAGVLLADILASICRSDDTGGAWFLPVTPGTRFVSVGGAIANDVHGKNHHRFGTFGRHVLSFDLARSNGEVVSCSPTENAALYRATIGGLGLTGLVLRATIQLRRVEGTALEAEDVRFDRLDEFFSLAAEADQAWDYTAAWVDCLATGRSLGRGIFSRARHRAGAGSPPPPLQPRITIPVRPPVSLVGGLGLRAFNALYWRKLSLRRSERTVGGYEPVFFPLDAIGGWNRLYGPRGFFQFQCVVPPAVAAEAIKDMLGAVAASGQGSMLAVLKTFGDLPSPGILSFPMAGATLALDFPDRGDSTRALLARLETITVAAGGRLYPAKDCVMTANTFRDGYAGLAAFKPHIDPAAASGFARRVGIIGPAAS